ncbi:MAG: hypothetical protein ACXWJW_11535 [Xanthobacteraceae bacterium]
MAVKTYFDASNTLFGTGTLSFSGGAFSGTASNIATSLLTPYSLTQVVTLTLGGSGIASFDSELQATPIPGALPLFVSGLGALGFAAYRRKRKALAV